MFKLCIVSIFFHLQEIHCNTLLRNMLFILYLRHRIFFSTTRNQNCSSTGSGTEAVISNWIFEQSRLIHTHKKAANVCLCARPGAAVFSTENQWDRTQEIGKQMRHEVPSMSRASSASRPSDQFTPKGWHQTGVRFILHSRTAAIILNYSDVYRTLVPGSHLSAAVLLCMYSVPAIF